MSTFSEKLARVRSSIVLDEPWASGSIEVPSHFLRLFYTDKDKPNHSRTLLLNKEASADELIHLSNTCQPATFGRGTEDVLDESYRKAGKLDTSSFASSFDLQYTNIVQSVVTKLFRGPDADAPVSAQLYKLNVYGPGSFFKAHTDTPRGTKLFGSLVIVFPTLHKGGSLAFRHKVKEFNGSGWCRKDKEFIFDSSAGSKLFDKGANAVAYVAFFSDVEHEVLPVTDGYRVTLTYNLYHVGLNPKTSILTDEVSTLMRALHSLVQDPTFLPHGGLLGFGLNFSYPVDVGSSSFKDVGKRLKGSDEMISTACTELGLPVYIRAVCHDSYEKQTPNSPYIMIDAPFDLGGEELEDSNITRALLSQGGTMIHPMGSDRPKEFMDLEIPGEFYEESEEVAWITPPTQYSSFDSTYLVNGNEAYISSFYAEVCLMVSIGAAGDRA